MFKLGDKLFYGKIGVCEVIDICEKEIVRNKKSSYYALKPVYLTNSIIYAPVNAANPPMRDLITQSECEALIKRIPEIVNKVNEDSFSEEYFKKNFDYQNPEDLILLTSFIYDKKKLAISSKKRLGFADEKFMKQGEALLFGEISQVLSIPLEEVESYIIEKLK